MKKMLDAPSEVLRQLMVNLNIVADYHFTKPFPCFTGYMPDVPDNVVATYDAGSQHDGKLLRTGEVVEHPAVQIQIRATNYNDGYDQASLIRNTLDQQADGKLVICEFGTYTIANVSRRTGVIFIGQEKEKPRRLFSLNVLLTILEM